MPLHMDLWINTQLLTLLTCWGGISEMTMMLFVAVAVISLLCNHVGSIWKTHCHSQVVFAEEGTWHDAILASWVLSMVTERIQVFSHVLDFRSSFSKGFAWLIFWFPFHRLCFCVACRRQHDIKPWVRFSMSASWRPNLWWIIDVLAMGRGSWRRGRFENVDCLMRLAQKEWVFPPKPSSEMLNTPLQF